MGAGFFAGRFLNFDRQTLANFAIYICGPVVIFGFVSEMDFKAEYVLLPVVSYLLSVLIAVTFLKIGHLVYKDNRANLLALCASMGNTGYFGLPVAMLLFDAHWLGVYMFMMIGFTTYEATVGYYIAARGQFTVRDSLIKLSKLPSIYATAAGIAFNLLDLPLPDLFHTYWVHFKGAYVITGMMIIGVALSKVEKFQIAPKFLLLAFAGKFVAWPVLTLLFILLDQTVLHLFESQVYKALCLLAIVPFAANIAAFAAQMDLRPEKAATTILLGTVFALFYIPAMLALLGMGM